jgi:hypothetical protein
MATSPATGRRRRFRRPPADKLAEVEQALSVWIQTPAVESGDRDLHRRLAELTISLHHTPGALADPWLIGTL